MLFFTLPSGKTALAMMQSTDNFTLSHNDIGFIYQDSNDSKLATEINKHLTNAIAVVEKKQFKKFTKPVKIYAVSNLDDFESYCGFRRVLGCVINEKIFMSPRLLAQPKGILPRLLTHELSHLHISQQICLLEEARIPTWFREGLAVYVANEAENTFKVNYQKAKEEIQKNNIFYPNKNGHLIFQKTHQSFGLTRKIFYRQSALFVKFLHEKDKGAFKNLLLSIQDKKPFSISFKKYYGYSIDLIWNQFIDNYQKS